jgi:hypothetical protein
MLACLIVDNHKDARAVAARLKKYRGSGGAVYSAADRNENFFTFYFIYIYCQC